MSYRYDRWRAGQVRLLPWVALLGVLGGCAAVGPSDSANWYDSQRSIVKQRAESRWAAVIKGDYPAAYDYFSPAYRSVVSLQQFQKSRGNDVQGRVVRVDDIQYDSPTVATVLLALTYRTSIAGSGGREVEMARELREQWLYKDGVWWYTSQ